MKKKKSGSSKCSVALEDSGSDWRALTERRTEKAKKIRRKRKDKDWCPRREKEIVPRQDNLMNLLTANPTVENLIVEDFYKARKMRKFKIAPTLRSDRIGLMVAPTIRAEHHNIADVHFVVSGQTTMTNTPVKSIDTSLETRNWLKEIFGKLTPILFPILTCSPLASLAKASQSLDSVKVSKTQEELFSLKFAGWLKLRDPDGFYLRMLKDFSIMIKEAHSKSSSPRWMNWGMIVNGKCLTLRLGYPKTGKGSLSSVLEEKVDEKYYLSGKMIAGLIKHQKHHKEQGHGFSAVFPDKQASSLTDRTGSTARGQDFMIVADRTRAYANKGRNLESPKEITNALSGVQKDNLILSNRIRRLTPKECERLQGFPDFFTSKGIDKEGKEVIISDTQRYKMMGNALSIPVIQAIGKRLAQGVL